MCVFVVSLPLMTMADAPGQYGANNCLMATSSGSAYSPGCALLGDLRRVAPAHPHGHQNGKKKLFIFSLLTRDKSSTVTIIKLIYSFKQIQAAAPSATPWGGSPVC